MISLYFSCQVWSLSKLKHISVKQSYSGEIHAVLKIKTLYKPLLSLSFSWPGTEELLISLTLILPEELPLSNCFRLEDLEELFNLSTTKAFGLCLQKLSKSLVSKMLSRYLSCWSILTFLQALIHLLLTAFFCVSRAGRSSSSQRLTF